MTRRRRRARSQAATATATPAAPQAAAPPHAPCSPASPCDFGLGTAFAGAEGGGTDTGVVVSSACTTRRWLALKRGLQVVRVSMAVALVSRTVPSDGDTTKLRVTL